MHTVDASETMGLGDPTSGLGSEAHPLQERRPARVAMQRPQQDVHR
jgi:hypothetical protein